MHESANPLNETLRVIPVSIFDTINSAYCDARPICVKRASCQVMLKIAHLAAEGKRWMGLLWATHIPVYFHHHGSVM